MNAASAPRAASALRQPRDVDGDPPPMPMLDVTPAPEAEPVRHVLDDEADM
jgi:hypothetical protein